MRWSFKLVRIKGIAIYLQFTFVLFFAWLIASGIADGIEPGALAWSALFVCAVFGSIILHEFGHAFVASYFGINANKITLFPIGGIASIDKLPEDPKQELLISAAGPSVSFILAAFCWLLSPLDVLLNSFDNFKGRLDVNNFFSLLGTINLLLGLFNLIPAFPMDGGRILRAVLAFRMNYVKATSVVASFGKVIAALIIVYGIGTMNFFFLLTGCFIILLAQTEQSIQHLKKLVQGIHLRDVLMYDYNCLDAELTINEAMDIMQHNHQQKFIVMQEGVPVGTLDRMDVMRAIADRQYNEKITCLMKDDLETMQGEILAENVLEKLSTHENRIYPVLEEGRFIGVISFQHSMEHLVLNKSYRVSPN